jgi:hypothetical protein
MKKASSIVHDVWLCLIHKKSAFLTSVAGEGKVKVVPDQQPFLLRNKGNNAKDVKKAKWPTNGSGIENHKKNEFGTGRLQNAACFLKQLYDYEKKENEL